MVSRVPRNVLNWVGAGLGAFLLAFSAAPSASATIINSHGCAVNAGCGFDSACGVDYNGSNYYCTCGGQGSYDCQIK